MKLIGSVELTSLKKMSSLYHRVMILIFLFTSSLLPQQVDFQSPQNIKLFADFLFCEKDYLRAIEEFEIFRSN
jgi:hypothetical protein